MREFADRFITENYDDIVQNCLAREERVSESSGYTSMDKFHDVLLSLYYPKMVFDSYEEYESWAMRKFTRKRGRCTGS